MFKAVILFTILSFGSVAHACGVGLRPPDLNNLHSADFIFRGDLVSYQVVKPEGQPNGRHYGLLTFDVVEQLYGNVTKTITLRWYNSSFPPYRTMPTGYRMVVAGKLYQPTIFQPNTENNAPELPILVHGNVLQEGCEFPFLFWDTIYIKDILLRVIIGDDDASPPIRLHMEKLNKSIPRSPEFRAMIVYLSLPL